MNNLLESLENLAVLALFGLLAGIGTMLASKEELTLRIVFGRALSSAALGVAAASILTFFPALPFEAQIGVACVFASLGTSSLEKLLQRLFR